jgi:hypothetical protein
VDIRQRREILGQILQDLGAERTLDAWVAGSPLVEVILGAAT